MHYILYAAIEGFYCQAQEAVPDQPLVVHKAKTVLDTNAAASLRGVTVGMPLPEARAILHGDGSFIAWAEEPYRAAQEAWLEVCADCTGVIEPEFQHSAWLDLSVHPEPFSIAHHLFTALENQSGTSVRLGLARSKWLAKLAANVHGDAPYVNWKQTMAECLQSPSKYLSPLPINCLHRMETEDRRRLHFLGYSTIGQIAELPFSLLKAQFGQKATTIQQLSLGGLADHVRPIYPKDVIRANFHFPNRAETCEQVEAGLIAIAKQVHLALQTRDAHGTQLELSLEFDDGKTETRQRTFIKPLIGLRSVLFALRLMADPLKQPVCSIHVRLLGLGRVSRKQKDLSGFYTRTADNENALKAVRQVFGENAIRQASDLVKSRRSRLLRLWKDATGWM